ncbi:MAG: tRNA 2-thiouridine(34) synthase MnmA [Oscillospiraceae bacterium]|nr:tRNA 2-thiouridine(34) synthase MnmA [Oscillospiraceae bacterium]
MDFVFRNVEPMELDKSGVLIAMSGGVDSSVAAFLMQEKGYNCLGTTMRLYQNNDNLPGELHTCCTEKDVEDAADCARRLGIPFEVANYTAEFKEKIIDKFIRTYESGGTPNPCIDCNRYMKFGKLIDLAKRRGLFYICTGHYARIEERDGRFLLKKAIDQTKDQSYVLYSLTQEQLEHIKFPLGEMTKSEVRSLAESEGFLNAHKHDSQDICFVPDGDYEAFMENYTGKSYQEGDFKFPDGTVAGRHHGAVGYTIGQRRGLGISYSEPVYVYDKDMDNNIVYVGTENMLYSTRLIANDVNWIAFDELTDNLRVTAKTRYRQKEFPATVEPLNNGRFKLVFDEPQRAVTKGQAVVLYQDDVVVGGGTIIEAIGENR